MLSVVLKDLNWGNWSALLGGEAGVGEGDGGHGGESGTWFSTGDVGKMLGRGCRRS